MRLLTRFMELQLQGARQLAHLIWGKPRDLDDVLDDLASVERQEDFWLQKKTLRGEMLRFEVARQNLVRSIFKPKGEA